MVEIYKIQYEGGTIHYVDVATRRGIVVDRKEDIPVDVEPSGPHVALLSGQTLDHALHAAARGVGQKVEMEDVDLRFLLDAADILSKPDIDTAIADSAMAAIDLIEAQYFAP